MDLDEKWAARLAGFPSGEKADAFWE